MAYPVVRAPGAVVNNPTSPLSVGYPSAFYKGDLLLIVVNVEPEASATATTPSGWSNVYNSGSAGTAACYYKIADGTETGTVSVTITGTITTNVSAVMYAVGNVDPVTPFTTATYSSGTGTTISDEGVTTLENFSLAVNIVCQSSNTIAAFSGESGGDWLETEGEVGTAAIQLQTAEMANPGTVNGGTVTIGVSSPWGVIGFAVQPGNGAIPTFVAASAQVQTATDGATITPSLPTSSVAGGRGWKPGDLAIVTCMTNGDNVPTIAAGWTEITGFAQNNAAQSTKAWWRVLQTGVTAPGVTDGGTTALSTSNGMFARMYVFRGYDTHNGQPFDVAAYTGNTGTETTPDTAAVTTTFNNDLVVNFCLIDDDTTWSSGNPPSGWKLMVADSTSTTGADDRMNAIAQVKGTAGSVAAAVVGTLSAAESWRSMTLALKPQVTRTTQITRAVQQAVQRGSYW
jgi:hypothetical protein